MRNIVCMLIFASLIMASCGNVNKTVAQISDKVNEVKDKVTEVKDTVSSVVDTVKKVTSDNTQSNSENVENNAENNDNDFFSVLDAIKGVHPGTAGSSLKVMYAAYNFLNSVKAKLPFDKMASDWIERQDKKDYADINESYSFVYDSLDNFKNSDVKDMLDA
ncbi:MAG: hypothetical protein MJ151_04145, partial [Lachnospiraceae bacterium]|nr:hypothetical protein [Lachnospiraceae bacterium]